MSRAEVLIAHPSASGKGSALSTTLHPADGGRLGYLDVKIAKQTSPILASQILLPGTPSRFDWDGAVNLRLYVSDLTQMLMVFRGYQESIQDGKGLFHRKADGTSLIVKMSHRIEPVPGYLFEVSEHPKDKGGEPRTAWIVFRNEEALWFCTALEASMGVLVFGEGGHE